MLQIAFYFALLSLVSVGGIPSVMPEMQRLVVDVQGWMSAAEYTQIFAIAQAAPGPNVLVTALIGWKVYGIVGGLVALGAFCGPAAVLARLGVWPELARPLLPLVEWGRFVLPAQHQHLLLRVLERELHRQFALLPQDRLQLRNP